MGSQFRPHLLQQHQQHQRINRKPGVPEPVLSLSKDLDFQTRDTANLSQTQEYPCH